MKIRHRSIAAGMLIALLVASGASAQSCGTNDFTLTSDATAQGLLVVGNSGYRGTISSGNLYPGTWAISVNDAGWPTSANSRRTYIRNNFYTYDAVNHVFNGTFPVSIVTFQMITQSMQFNGTATLNLTAPDTDLDGVLDTGEFNGAQVTSATVNAPCGTSTPVCGGPGSGNGSVMGSGPVSQPITGAMTTTPCATSVATDVWGSVKALYRD